MNDGGDGMDLGDASDPRRSSSARHERSNLHRATPSPGHPRIERVQRPTISRVSARLGQAGLIERMPDELDGRGARLRLAQASELLERMLEDGGE
jgi:DNA-binding transcriptional ArsR family regulator